MNQREQRKQGEMKITAGLGSIDEYVRFIEAGADECFCGYVPYSWSAKYGAKMPLNRREVLCCNVQIGSYSELEILAGMVRRYRKPVHLTFNSLFYLPEQYPEIAKIICSCMELGFHSFILADPALIVYLRAQGIDCEIHLSGEIGEINTGSIRALSRLGLTRVIFHRKNTFADMRAVTGTIPIEIAVPTEFEAFVLNENCQFTGAFCNSLHGDEIGHLCRVPYWLAPVEAVEDRKDSKSTSSQSERGRQEWEQMRQSGRIDEDGELTGGSNTEKSYDEDGYLCGESGCGLCALWKLQDAGITHLKLVGRGNYVDFMERDIRNLSWAREILANSTSEIEFQKNVKREIFPYGCGGNCYYRA
ncbi:U32 family peptidase [Brotaphodocola sp.]|uniref:U32 family peptidase n=1 Tax=Brotaphodocola sp. TaxID=3073577 RepID=UPI003D7D29CF